MRYYELITEDYPSVTKKFIDAGADSAEVKEYIAQFKKLNVDHKLDHLDDPAEKNIDVWGSKTFADFKKFVDFKLDLPIFLPAPLGWQIYIPVTKTQSCFYTHADTRTTWCTAKPNQDNYEDYFLDINAILIYCFRSADKAHWAIACHKDLPDKFEFFNSQQQPPSLTQGQFDQQTGLNSAEIIQSALGHAGVEPARAAAKLTSIPHLIRKALTPDPALEKKILATKNAMWMYEYALKFKPRVGWPAAEPTIANDARLAYMYALNVMKKRWEPGELAIAQNAELAYRYARDVLEGERFLAGEPVIAQNAPWAYRYAKFVMNTPWPAAEPAIARNAEWAYRYAQDVLEGERFLAGEPEIAKDAAWAVYYARDVLEGERFLAGEPAIAQNAARAYIYARDVLKGERFPAGEPVIAQNAPVAYEYAQYVLKDPKPNTWGKRYLAQQK